MKNQPRLLITSLTSALILAFSWIALFGVASGPITWSLTPYDTTPLANRPPVGTWQRDFNDFFLNSPGKSIPATLVSSMSVILFAIALKHLPNSVLTRIRLMLLFALSNLTVVAAIFLSIFMLGNLSLELTPYPGYGWTIKFLIPEVLLLLGLLGLQVQGIPKRLTRVSAR